MIQRLSAHVRTRLANESFIYTPADALSELIANSIDAGATIIRVVTRNYGLSEFSVLDNGCGISDGPDIELLADQGCTSKASQISDIFVVQTHGFRGNSLSHISSCSNLIVCTRSNPHAPIIRAVYENGAVAHRCIMALGSEDIALTTFGKASPLITLPGTFTLMTVKDFFPLSPDKQETLSTHTPMLNVVKRYSLANPHISMDICDMSKNASRSVLLSYLPRGSMRERIYDIFPHIFLDSRQVLSSLKNNISLDTNRTPTDVYNSITSSFSIPETQYNRAREWGLTVKGAPRPFGNSAGLKASCILHNKGTKQDIQATSNLTTINVLQATQGNESSETVLMQVQRQARVFSTSAVSSYEQPKQKDCEFDSFLLHRHKVFEIAGNSYRNSKHYLAFHAARQAELRDAYRLLAQKIMESGSKAHITDLFFPEKSHYASTFAANLLEPSVRMKRSLSAHHVTFSDSHISAADLSVCDLTSPSDTREQQSPSRASSRHAEGLGQLRPISCAVLDCPSHEHVFPWRCLSACKTYRGTLSDGRHPAIRDTPHSIQNANVLAADSSSLHSAPRSSSDVFCSVEKLTAATLQRIEKQCTMTMKIIETQEACKVSFDMYMSNPCKRLQPEISSTVNIVTSSRTRMFFMWNAKPVQIPRLQSAIHKIILNFFRGTLGPDIIIFAFDTKIGPYYRSHGAEFSRYGPLYVDFNQDSRKVILGLDAGIEKVLIDNVTTQLRSVFTKLAGVYEDYFRHTVLHNTQQCEVCMQHAHHEKQRDSKGQPLEIRSAMECTHGFDSFESHTAKTMSYSLKEKSVNSQSHRTTFGASFCPRIEATNSILGVSTSEYIQVALADSLSSNGNPDLNHHKIAYQLNEPAILASKENSFPRGNTDTQRTIRKSSGSLSVGQSISRLQACSSDKHCKSRIPNMRTTSSQSAGESYKVSRPAHFCCTENSTNRRPHYQRFSVPIKQPKNLSAAQELYTLRSNDRALITAKIRPDILVRANSCTGREGIVIDASRCNHKEILHRSLHRSVAELVRLEESAVAKAFDLDERESTRSWPPQKGMHNVLSQSEKMNIQRTRDSTTTGCDEINQDEELLCSVNLYKTYKLTTAIHRSNRCSSNDEVSHAQHEATNLFQEFSQSCSDAASVELGRFVKGSTCIRLNYRLKRNLYTIDATHLLANLFMRMLVRCWVSCPNLIKGPTVRYSCGPVYRLSCGDDSRVSTIAPLLLALGFGIKCSSTREEPVLPSSPSKSKEWCVEYLVHPLLLCQHAYAQVKLLLRHNQAAIPQECDVIEFIAQVLKDLSWPAADAESDCVALQMEQSLSPIATSDGSPFTRDLERPSQPASHRAFAPEPNISSFGHSTSADPTSNLQSNRAEAPSVSISDGSRFLPHATCQTTESCLPGTAHGTSPHLLFHHGDHPMCCIASIPTPEFCKKLPRDEIRLMVLRAYARLLARPVAHLLSSTSSSSLHVAIFSLFARYLPEHDFLSGVCLPASLVLNPTHGRAPLEALAPLQ